MDGIHELDLVGQHRDVSLHPALHLVVVVGIDGNQFFKFSLLLLLKSKTLVKLLLERSAIVN